MFKRYLTCPHRFICITDELRGDYGPGVEVVPTPPAAAAIAALLNPEGGRFPSCYRRLWMFSREAAELGDQLLLIDIDLVLTGDITALVDRSEDFVGWRPMMKWGRHVNRFGGGLYLLRAGTRAHVWERFTGAKSVAEARAAGYRGSDQAWLSYQLSGADEASWPDDSGIYSIRDLKDGLLPLPADARLIQFNGPVKPWQSTLPWVKKYWTL